jgi:hypothetical protein
MNANGAAPGAAAASGARIVSAQMKLARSSLIRTAI